MKLLEKVFIILAFACFILIIAAVNTEAQTKKGSIVIGEQFALHSDILDEERVVNIYTPIGYDRSDNDYPVIFLLDGSAHFKHTAGLIEHFFQIGRMPAALLVAITNTQRTRDLTPPVKNVDERFKDGGGADNFLGFIKSELIPFVEDNYRTADYRVLIGHSFGGLFAAYSLIKEPDLFNGYICISPAMWWDDESYITQTEKFLSNNDSAKVFFFASMGSEGARMEEPFGRYEKVLMAAKNENFRPVVVRYPDENHGTIPHIATMEGLQELFAPWTYPYNLEGKTLDDLLAYYDELSKKLDFKIDCPEATINIAGYTLMGANKAAEAEECFLYNIEHFPNSPNVYDSYGDWHYQFGDKKGAFTYYMRALELGKQQNHPYISVFKQNVLKVKMELSADQEY